MHYMGIQSKKLWLFSRTGILLMVKIATGSPGGASAAKVRADPESGPCSPHGPPVPSLPPLETRFAT